MELKHRRMLIFYTLHLVYFPCLVLCLRMLHHARVIMEQAVGDALPPWFFPILGCVAAGVLYVGMGYAADGLFRRRLGARDPAGKALLDAEEWTP